MLSNEFSFKEMRTWSQSKTSSCCLYLWCKSRELGGRGSPRFPTAMVESFSADPLPAIRSYWPETHLESYTASAKSQSVKEHLTSLLFWISYLSIFTRVWPVCLRWVSPGFSRKSYWRESHMKFCLASTMELLFESTLSAFGWLALWWLCWWSSSSVVSWCWYVCHIYL